MSLPSLLRFTLPSVALAEDECSPDNYEGAIYEDGACKLFGPDEFCAEIYNGDCPTFDEITDGEDGPGTEITRCGPGSVVASIVEFSHNEGGTRYYFNDAGDMLGAYNWSFLGPDWCCEGQTGDSMLFGIETPTCTPVPEEEPKDSRWSCAKLSTQAPGLVLLGAALLLTRRRRPPSFPPLGG